MALLNTLTVLAVLVTLAVHYTDAGVSFVRWGRSVCPTGTVKLYKGYMAGSHYNAGGSGANYLCITDEPQFVRPKAGRQGTGGMVLGVEFDLVDAYAGVFNPENIPDGRIVQNDMLCVVCYVEGSYDKLVLPGRQDCGKSGYDLQYKGFMVSEWSGPRGRSQFVCMDESPEGRIGGTNDDNQAVIYPVEIGCGSLPCNPFVDGYELPCAVCTY